MVDSQNKNVKLKVVDLTKIFDQDPFAKFLKEQNIIAFQLSLIIKLSASFSDKRFINWLERKTLGELIQIFKGIAEPFRDKVFKIHRPQGYTMKELIKYLEEYNKKRRKIIHELLKIKFESEDDIRALGEELNQKADIILPILGQLVKELLDQQLQKIGKLIAEPIDKLKKLGKQVKRSGKTIKKNK